MKRWRWLCGILVLALVAAACGDDDSGGGTAQTPTPDGSTTTAPDEGEPVSGGELVVLFQSERRALDPITATPSGASTGPTDFAIYGALVGYVAADNEVRPILAESLEPNDSFDVWTLKIRPNITFTDGSPYNAEAVKVNWERGKDPASRSSSFAVLQTVSEMVLVDPLTLEIHLTAPNSVFHQTVSKYNINYIASAEAIRSGHDLTSDPVGAGPFMLESWTRDDRMVLVRNPNWYDAPRPYLDRLVVRIVPEETQRLDTFLTGDGDAIYTAIAPTITAIEEAGHSYSGTPVAHNSSIIMNATRPPFDDPTMRQFLAEAIDYQALVDVAEGEGAVAPDSFTPEALPWHSDNQKLPEHNPAHAQELLDAYVAANGPLTIDCLTSQSNRTQSICKFMQSTLNQMNGINVTVTPVDTPSLITRSYGHDFDFGIWGFPAPYPDPGLFLAVNSASSANPMGFASSEVDALFAEAREVGDGEARVDIYRQIYELLSVELPFIPTDHGTFGYGYTENVHGVEYYEDGIARFDLIWKD